MGWETLSEIVRGRFRSERAAALIEWGLLVVLVAVVALIAVQFAGDQNSSNVERGSKLPGYVAETPSQVMTWGTRTGPPLSLLIQVDFTFEKTVH